MKLIGVAYVMSCFSAMPLALVSRPPKRLLLSTMTEPESPEEEKGPDVEKRPEVEKGPDVPLTGRITHCLEMTPGLFSKWERVYEKMLLVWPIVVPVATPLLRTIMDFVPSRSSCC